MIVNRKAWHYRIAKLFWGELQTDGWGGAIEVTNLCRYFWQCVASIFGVVLFTGLISILIISLTVLFLEFLTEPMWLRMQIIIAVSWVLSSIFLPIGIIQFFRYKDIDTEISTPKLVKEFIKAKKNKYCPIIKFKN